MKPERLLYTRAAKTRLQELPVEVRVHLETHLENLSLLAESTAPGQLPRLLARADEGFVTAVSGARVFFVVDGTARTLLIHRIEVPPGDEDSASTALEHARDAGPIPSP